MIKDITKNKGVRFYILSHYDVRMGFDLHSVVFVKRRMTLLGKLLYYIGDFRLWLKER